MKFAENRERVLTEARAIISTLPERPLRASIVGSMITRGASYHDIDLYLVYDTSKEWMIDQRRKVRGIPIPFDLFFFVPITQDELQWALTESGLMDINF